MPSAVSRRDRGPRSCFGTTLGIRPRRSHRSSGPRVPRSVCTSAEVENACMSCWETTMPDLDRRFRSLDLLEAPDVSDEIDRRSALPSKTVSEGMSRRVVAGVLAFALFVGAALFAWSVWRSRPDHAVLHTPSPPPPTDLFPGIGAGLTEMPPPPRLLESGVTVWTGRELILWGGNVQFGDPPHFNEGY